MAEAGRRAHHVRRRAHPRVPAGIARRVEHDLGAPVPLSGRYAVQGAQVRLGLEAWARDTGASVAVLDDGSDPGASVRLTDELRRRCRVVLGPYGSDCVRAVAGSTDAIWNHGAAADDVHRLRGVLSLPSPASRYLVALGRAVAELRPRASVAVLAARGRFASFARDGLVAEARYLGLTLVKEPDEAEAVLLCGPLEWELERFRTLDRSKLLGGVAPGLAAFARLLEPEGLLAPVQWHPEHGGPAGLDDYVAAQAYAAALLATRHDAGAARTLRTQTFFGAFELAADGLQVGHRLSVVRWRSGRQTLLLPGVA